MPTARAGAATTIVDPAPSSFPARRARGAGRPLLRAALVATGCLALAVAALVAAFFLGVAIPLDFLRGRIERAAAEAVGTPVRIEGPIRFATGRVARVSAGGVTLADPLRAQGPALVRVEAPSVRIDLGRLWRGAIVLESVAAERIELRLARSSEGKGNWEALARRPAGEPGGPALIAVAKITVARVEVVYHDASGDAPIRVDIAGLEVELPEGRAASARGTVGFAGRRIAVDARGPALADLQVPDKDLPLEATLAGEHARLAVRGAYARKTGMAEAEVELAAADADRALAAFGLSVRGAGPLAARGSVRVSATEAAIEALHLRLGENAVTGSGRAAWAGPKLGVVLAIAAERLDTRPFLAEGGTRTGGATIESLVHALDALAGAADVEARIRIGELVGLPVALRDLSLEGRSAAAALAARLRGVVSGMRVDAALEYDARDRRRIVKARVEGGRFSLDRLPSAARPAGASGTLGGVRGEAHARGANARELVASLRASLAASDVRLELARAGAPPLELRLDSARLAIDGTRASRAELRGRLGTEPYAIRVSGGALEKLLAGERWPLEAHASHGEARVDARGEIAVGDNAPAGEVAFEASARRIGPLLAAFGLDARAAHPAAARGRVVAEAGRVRVELEQARLGNTQGAGRIAVPFGDQGAPSVALAFDSLDAEELAALAPGAGDARKRDAAPRAVLPTALRLPDLDFELSAQTVRFGADRLRAVRTAGSIREGRLADAKFGLEWQGVTARGTARADFRGARPAVEIEASTERADLTAALARLGIEGVALRAARVEARARASGALLDDLLASATGTVAVTEGTLQPPKRLARWVKETIGFTGSLEAAEGRPTRLAARGTLGEVPFDAAVESGTLPALAIRRGALPIGVRGSVGDARVTLAGQVDAEGAGAIDVRVEGSRIDRLGALADWKLPQVGPYSAAGNVVVARDAVRASDLDVRVGASRLVGKVEVRTAGQRPLYAAELRAPILHLEHLGPERWLRRQAGAQEAPPAAAADAAVARVRELLQAFDARIALDVDELLAAGRRIDAVRLRATLADGDLRLALKDAEVVGGTVALDLRLDSGATPAQWRVRATAEGLDYGPLARSVNPQTTMAGTIDLRLDLAAAGAPGQLMSVAKGTIDVALFPRGFESGLLDFWGVGVLQLLGSVLDPGAESRLNCSAASFDVAGGVARSRTFFADTTRVRVVGELETDFATRRIAGRLTPRAKNPEIFSVAPTVTLGGALAAPQIRLSPETLVLDTLRFSTSLHTFALDFLTRKRAPADGSADCREAFERGRH